MIQKALQYIVNLAEPKVQTINGETYSDKALHHVSFNPKARPIEADGGAWEVEAKEAIKAYLVAELEGYEDIVVIS